MGEQFKEGDADFSALASNIKKMLFGVTSDIQKLKDEVSAISAYKVQNNGNDAINNIFPRVNYLERNAVTSDKFNLLRVRIADLSESLKEIRKLEEKLIGFIHGVNNYNSVQNQNFSTQINVLRDNIQKFIVQSSDEFSKVYKEIVRLEEARDARLVASINDYKLEMSAKADAIRNHADNKFEILYKGVRRINQEQNTVADKYIGTLKLMKEAKTDINEFNTDVSSRLSIVNSEITKLKGFNSDMMSEIKTRTLSKNYISSELSGFKSTIKTEQQKQNEYIQKNLSLLNTRINDISEKLKLLKESSKSPVSKGALLFNPAYEKKVSILESEFDVLSSRLDSYKKGFQDISSKTASFESLYKKDLLSIKSHYDSKINVHSDDLSSLKKRISELDSKEKIKEILNRLEDVEGHKGEMKKLSSQLKESINDLKDDIKDLTGDIKEYDIVDVKIIDDLKNDVDKIKKQTKDVISANYFDQQYESMTSQLESLRTIMDDKFIRKTEFNILLNKINNLEKEVKKASTGQKISKGLSDLPKIAKMEKKFSQLYEKTFQRRSKRAYLSYTYLFGNVLIGMSFGAMILFILSIYLSYMQDTRIFIFYGALAAFAIGFGLRLLKIFVLPDGASTEKLK